jgi:hypothetical protein
MHDRQLYGIIVVGFRRRRLPRTRNVRPNEQNTRIVSLSDHGVFHCTLGSKLYRLVQWAATAADSLAALRSEVRRTTVTLAVFLYSLCSHRRSQALPYTGLQLKLVTTRVFVQPGHLCINGSFNFWAETILSVWMSWFVTGARISTPAITTVRL